MAQAVPFIVAGVAAAGQAVSAYKKAKYHTRQAQEALEAKNRRMAAATREAQEERRRAQFIESRARAVGAASGAVGPGLVRQFAELAAEGEYRALARVWQGQNDAQGLIARAKANYKAARDAKVMGVINTVTTAFSTYAGMGGSFGGTPAPTGGVQSAQGYMMSPVPDYQNVGKLWTSP